MKNYTQDFPLLRHNPDLIYVDNAATTHKPKQVIDAITNFYAYHNATIKRGMYHLAEQASAMYEQARAKVATYVNAHAEEIIFTSGATEGINFIATTWATDHLKEDDEIVLTQLEHHANLLPWQQLAKKKKIIIKFIPVDKHGSLVLTNIDTIITKKTKLVSFLDVSNALGTHINVAAIVQQARLVGARILIDACQSMPHTPVDVKKYDCDFLVFSGHKMLGPTGIGVLYIKKELQSEVQPYQFGGGMINEASFNDFVLREAPHCYEAGTPPIAQAIGLAYAIDYLQSIDKNALRIHEAQLCSALVDGLQKNSDIVILGPIEQLCITGSMVSFIHKKYHAHDVGAYLDQHTICVRTGHYCAQPLARALGIESSIRISFYLYNSLKQVEKILTVLSNLT